MPQVFRSGAFLQQCWSVHPLCILVKRMADGNRLILSCTSCRFVHHLTLSAVVVRASAVLDESDDQPGDRHPAQGGQAQLVGCLEAHAAALSLREMDVFEDLALIRCAECRRHYALTVSSFETHQK
jgi:hypothetical protein